MKKFILGCVFMSIGNSYAALNQSNQIQQSPVTLEVYNTYIEYREKFKSNISSANLMKYFTKPLVESIESSIKRNPEYRPSFGATLIVKDWNIEINGKYACLALKGLNKKGSIVGKELGYININGLWKLGWYISTRGDNLIKESLNQPCITIKNIKSFNPR